jgi:CubicO group peptidase (beta-lactamase class C family)
VRAGAMAVTDAVTGHIPELGGSGYDGTTVLDLLTMTTGVDWVEDHRDPSSIASRLLGCFAPPLVEEVALATVTRSGDSRALLCRVRAGVRPGTRFSYCTADSQVLDWVRERATGTSYADAAADLWRTLGCTRDAVVAVDGRGTALAGGGLAATSRDWIRVAGLAVDGEPLLTRDWVESAARPAYPFLAVGRLPSSITTHAGFGYHWWPMDDDGERVTADGSRGQFAAADRRTGAVVVKTSQWPYDDFLVDRQARDLSYLGLHALLDAVSIPPPKTKESSQ